MATTAEYKIGPFTYPRGWFMIADSDELEGKPLALRFFGKDLVLYRGESGRVVLMDAYCPHMKTHLAANSSSYVVHDGSHIEGDNIRCPYHAWRFGPDGICNEIPYFDGRIPAAARIKTYRAEERYGAIFTWHDPEEREPDYDLPALPQWDDPSYVRWTFDRLGVMKCHPQEIVDNIADLTHLGPVHGSTVEYYENEFRAHVAVQRQGGGHRTLVTNNAMLETGTWYTGPGVLMSRVTGLFEAMMFIAHTPVDDGVVKAWHALLVKSPSDSPTEEDVAAARAYQETSRLAFAQDFDIWTNKAPCFNVLQLPTDGPFGKARIWYSQFYRPRSEAEAILARVEGIHPVRGMPPAPEAARTAVPA
ncbi:Rieske 2Fe-2S domain-containing protein [Sphingosinicella terrae]|uniref:Rieske 2Fe-2S domain-containing protein n=1 Tax=Sphingosinicella terrae TaxID=2172047 RepID=UPI000E0D2C39|nr:Rieske 2Fe-2S domain-containing protein [Sphingosinicella terrae]